MKSLKANLRSLGAKRRGLLLTTVFLCVSGFSSHVSGAQAMIQRSTQGTASPSSLPSSQDADQPVHKTLEEKQALARNTERQKRLVADTDKLLALATQLHEDVGKTDKNILSLDVVKRAAEIERLAHDVKERMKG